MGRVAAGVHHTIDVLGSVVIAVTATFIATALLQKLLPKETNDIE